MKLEEKNIALVYIVDSDSEVGNSIRFLLESDNIKAVVFTEGEKLLEHALLFPPHCVVVEALMSDMSGVALLNRLRESGLQIPVIMLANSSDVSMAVAAVKSGACDYFEKPFLQRALLESVNKAILAKPK